jgi:membrane associated rhomboid family serine protease
MILMVPISPEVPPLYRPRIWQGLVLVLILTLSFLENQTILKADTEFIQDVQKISLLKKNSEQENIIKKRPLLRIAPARSDFDLKRLLQANFLHGNTTHLFLNLVGAFAGARICATFIPFLCTLSIFIIGGSLGLWFSLFFTQENSFYIPHIGASAGIFAMMGTYYVYNFRFRTQYFFWIPNRNGIVPLKTSWFFFLDVLLLEIVLSVIQLTPQKLDNIDHLAHVVGFLSGVSLAFLLRYFQKWPAFLQTRGEFIYWKDWANPQKHNPIMDAFSLFVQLLQLNPYNDEVKNRLIKLVIKNPEEFDQKYFQIVFEFLRPSYFRRNADTVAYFIKYCLKNKIPLPKTWLQKLPYDGAILIVKAMASSREDYGFLIMFLESYSQMQDLQLQDKVKSLVLKLYSQMPELQKAS